MTQSSSTVHLWLRDEVKPQEKRTPLTPSGITELLRSGMRVTVERSRERIIADSEYEATGCEMAHSQAWRTAPREAWILELKELPSDDLPLAHRHIYFAHAYKGQKSASQILSRFVAGGGQIYDLEFLVDESGRRVAAFGYWAGFVGAALALKVWLHREEGNSGEYPPVTPFANSDALKQGLERAKAHQPRVVVLGPRGRSGKGAVDLLKQVGLEQVAEWGRSETQGLGDRLLKFDILVNCILLESAIEPFLRSEDLFHSQRKLKVVCDVSCDWSSPHNPLPIYHRPTTFKHPVSRTAPGPGGPEEGVDVIAIDHLPGLLPRESSEDFSEQLLPHLLSLSEHSPVWKRAGDLFALKSKAEAA